MLKLLLACFIPGVILHLFIFKDEISFISIPDYLFPELNMCYPLFSTQAMTPSERDNLFSLMSNSHRGRMDDQRCVLGVSPQPTPEHKPGQSTFPKGWNLFDFCFYSSIIIFNVYEIIIELLSIDSIPYRVSFKGGGGVNHTWVRDGVHSGLVAI